MKLEAYICPQCGGQINPARHVCEYCGTHFKGQTEVIKIVAERPGVHTLSCDVAIANEAISAFGAEKASEIALKEIAGKMSKCIMPYISIQTSDMDLWMENMTRVRGRLRVLDPKEWVR